MDWTNIGTKLIVWSAVAERIKEWAQLTNQRQYNALYKGERREYSLDTSLNAQILEGDQY